MTATLTVNDVAIAEITEIQPVKLEFEKACEKKAESMSTLTSGVMSFSCKIDNPTVSFEELKAQWDRLSRPQKPKITDRQIFKTMRMRGIR